MAHSNHILLPEAKQALDSFRKAIILELHSCTQSENNSGGNIDYRECGIVPSLMIANKMDISNK